jgi:hypothetical protein
MPAELFELRQEQLHEMWPFILRGLDYVKKKLKPNWIPPDLYAFLRNGQLNCIIARRAERLLGFVIYGRQLRPFDFKPELFVWVAYELPMREWEPADEMPVTVQKIWQYLANLAKTQYQTDEITWLTRPGRAKAFARKFGWKPSWVTISVKI